MQDIELTEALWRLGNLPLQAVEDFATQALVDGCDGPALRELAWPHASWDEVTPLVEQAFQEMGRPPITHREALARLVHAHAVRISSGEVDPFKEAQAAFYKIAGYLEHWEDYESILDFDRWVDDAEAHPEQVGHFRALIVQRARDLLDQDPVTLSHRLLAEGSYYPRTGAWIKENTAKIMVFAIDPSFRAPWEKYLEDWGSRGEDRPALCTYMIQFAHHLAGRLSMEDAEQMRPVFNLMERLMVEGVDLVKTVVATCFLESLLNQEKVSSERYVHLLGVESIAYIRAWDQFTGATTKGLPPSEAGESNPKRPWWRLW